MWFTLQSAMRFLFAIWFRYEAHGIEQIPMDGGGLLIGNHESHLDPLVMGVPIRRPVSFVVRDTLLKVPVIGWIIRVNYSIPISRGATSAS